MRIGLGIILIMIFCKILDFGLLGFNTYFAVLDTFVRTHWNPEIETDFAR